MQYVPKRLFPLALLLLSLAPACAGVQPLTTGTTAPPQFLTSSSATAPYPYYEQFPFDGVPVGKTLVLPIAVSGSGPMSYSVTSGSRALAPIVKTGYPVLNINVTYTGYPSGSGTFPFSTLYGFDDGADGGNPYAGLASGTDGNLYGTTVAGGSGYGTVFQLTTSGSLATLYTFTGSADGAAPYATLIQGTSGELYGAAETGGTSGAGTVFEITTTGSFATLYTFTGGADGANPYAPLYQGSAGNLFGTTEAGGSGYGTVFELSTTGQLTTLYTFTGGADGANPYAGLILGSNGNFYGTTSAGGASSAGTIFEITTSGSLTTLYSFTGGLDGGNPRGGLLQGSDGNFYGTTVAGGSEAGGTIFQLTSSGSLNTLYSFTGGTDGEKPYSSLIQVNGGYLYGTASAGGADSLGTIFQIATSGSASFNSIYSFGGGGDGADPYGPLVQGTGGTLYGTAELDGSNGFGTVYAITTGTAVPFSGTMTFALLRDMAPVTCGYISAFAESGSYNNLDFFRITNLASSGEQATYIAQTGDPTETGTGTPGFAFDNEFSPSLIFDGQGQLAMANSGIDQTTFKGTNGAQFFITQNPLRSLDFGYTIFGQLIRGFDVMEKVMSVPLQSDSSSPVTPVVMNSVTVSEDNTDAILLVNAAGAAPNGATLNVNATDPSGNKAVVVSGTTSTPGLTLEIATYDDIINDPPILVPDSNVSALLHQKVSLPLKAIDLEYDYLITGAEALSDPSFATVNTSGNVATVIPSSATPLGGVSVGLYVYQPFTSTERASAYDLRAVEVGLGSGKLTPEPTWFYGVPNSTVYAGTASLLTPAYTFGSFLVSNPGLSVGDLSASINWGDEGMPETGSNTVTIGKSSYLPTAYTVTDDSSHIYTGAGIYPLDVTVSNTNGGITEIENTAIIAPGPIYALGRTFAAPKGVANGLIATFMDRSSNVIAADYKAAINWGDGSIGAGVIKGSHGFFQVFGSHKYTGGNTYPVDVTVSNVTIAGDTGYAWSTVNVSGVPTHQPPFAQSHIVGQIGNPGYGSGYLDEDVTLINSGNLPSGPITLQFYLSSTADTQPIDSSAILLNIGKGTTYKADSVPAGGAIQGTVSDIIVPSGVTSQGKYIIMQVITSDPIGNHMYYPRAFADPYPLVE